MKRLLSDTQKSQALEFDQTIVTNLRHYQALTAACAALKCVRSSLSSKLTSDLLAEDLRSALHHLGSITGEITTDEVLGDIFSHFCIGK